MKLQLKNIKYAAFASQETACYEATLWVDGKMAGHVSNQGFGGCDSQHFASPEIEAKVHAYFKSLPKIRCQGMELDASLELWCGEEVEVFNAVKRLKASAKRKVQILMPDGVELGFKFAPKEMTPTLRAKLLAKYEGARIIHEMSDAEIEALVRNQFAKEDA